MRVSAVNGYVPAGSVKTKPSTSTSHDCDFAIEPEDVAEVF